MQKLFNGNGKSVLTHFYYELTIVNDDYGRYEVKGDLFASSYDEAIRILDNNYLDKDEQLFDLRLQIVYADIGDMTFVESVNTFDDARADYKLTQLMINDHINYLPTCPYGRKDCVLDPAYIKYHQPEYYKKVYGDLEPEAVSDLVCRKKLVLKKKDDGCCESICPDYISTKEN